MRTRGFTLLEMMVVVAILAVLGTAVVALLTGGLRAWEQVQNVGEPQAQAALGFEIPERDLHNAIPFFAIPFQGAADSVAFPTLLSVTNGMGQAQYRIGTVRYVLDRTLQMLRRTAWPYPYPESSETMAEAMMSQVENLALQYLEVSTNGTGVGWRDSWQETNRWPAAVRWTVQGARGASQTVVQRTIFLVPRPAGSH
jgi:prepilin-type N-terminal cleavage/methylation domain-containing protein